jgi:hypothetical protein
MTSPRATSPSRIPFRLYVFLQPSCPICTLAGPIIDQFQRKHPEGIVVRTHRRELNGFKAKATPTYLFIADMGEPMVHEGILELEEMEEVHGKLFPDDEDDPDLRPQHDDSDGDENGEEDGEEE